VKFRVWIILVTVVALLSVVISRYIVLPHRNKITHLTAKVPLPSPLAANLPLPKRYDHIVLIIMENKPSASLLNSSNAPFINHLIKNYTLVPNYSAVANPSLPNYLALIGGSTFGVTSDCTSCYINAPNLVDSLENKGLSWKAYMESMPQPCFVGSAGLYAQKHDPFVYFDNIRTNSTKCDKVVPLDQLSQDLNSTNTPNFIWITPNLCHDMHDCSITEGDTWLSQEVPGILNSSIFTSQNSLLILTFDEGDASDNRILTILIDPKKKIQVGNGPFSHYSLLHSIENYWNLPTLTNNDASAPTF